MTNKQIADHQQRLEAIDCSKSFIVQAPAGSGKTELLIQRFLALLSKVENPQEVLAITFTKKAANEMRERVLSSLHSAKAKEPHEEHKKQTWRLAHAVLTQDDSKDWKLLENPNQLKIQTIDSFCSYLTKQLPVLSYFGSQPEISLSPNKMYRETVQEVLSHVNEDLDWSDSIANILLYLDNDMSKMESLLINLIEKRDQWISHIGHALDKDAIKEILEENIAAIINEHLSSLIDLIPKNFLDELIEIANYCLGNLSKDNILKNDLQPEQLGALSHWQFLAELLLTSKGDWRKRVDSRIGFIAVSTLKNPEEKQSHQEFKDRHKQLMKDLEAHDVFASALHAIRKLPGQSLSSNHADVLIDLIVILKILCAQLRLTFKKYGCIDFCENSLAALNALGSDEAPTDLALSLDYRIMHILIDEFQDTSSSQFSLLKKLVAGWQADDGRSLFIVGDPMQSIYRFREAEVGLFLRMWESGINDIKLNALTLSVNFRSDETIVDQNNRYFSQIFPPNTHIPSGAVSFTKSIASSNTSGKAKHNGVTIQGFIDDGSSQAKYIVDQIQDLLSAHPTESIAILVRSRSHLNHIIHSLKEKGIHYRAVDIDPLEQQPHIQDLYALSRALLHLHDRIAWLSILRAPWCGFTLNDLHVIAHDRDMCIWQSMNDKQINSQLSRDGQDRLKRILPIIKQALDNQSRYSLRYRVQHCWLLLGGPACLKQQGELNDVDMFFKLLEKQTENSLDLSIEQLEESLIKLYAQPIDENTQVQLMTIHSSKGLEFDTVILPHLERKPRSDDKSLLAWMEYPLKNNRIATLLAPLPGEHDSNTVYDFINHQNKRKADNEAKRLLYVATTRSKKRLFLTFSLADKDKIPANSFLSMLNPFVKENEISDNLEEQSNIGTHKADNILTRLSSEWLNPYQLASNKEFQKHQSYQGFYMLSQHDHITGSVVHIILQKLSVDGIDWWKNIKQPEKIEYIHTLLLFHGMPREMTNNHIDDAINCIENTISDQKGLWLLSQDLEAHNEYALSLKHDDNIENIIIDKTFVCENNIRWIIDYKTSSTKDKDLNAFLAEEKDKYSGKMTIYAKAVSALDDRPIKCGLYFPAVPCWIEWDAN